MSASDKPRLAGRQPSNRGGVPRVKTWPVGAIRRAGKRGESLSRTDPSVQPAFPAEVAVTDSTQKQDDR